MPRIAANLDDPVWEDPEMFRNPLIDAAVVLIVVLLIFGPKRLPTLGRSLGQGMREFKDSITGHHDDHEDEEHPALTESAGSASDSKPAADSAPAADSTAAAAPSNPAPSTPERESAEVGSREARS